MTEHHTAWLTTDRSCLDQDMCDLTVLQDAITGYNHAPDGTELPRWSTDVDTDPKLYAVTTIPAEQPSDAIKAAEDILTDAGWSLTSQWEATPSGYIAPVTRNN